MVLHVISSPLYDDVMRVARNVVSQIDRYHIETANGMYFSPAQLAFAKRENAILACQEWAREFGKPVDSEMVSV